MTLYLSSKGRKLYLITTKDDITRFILDTSLSEGLKLMHTGSCIYEYRIRTLEAWEKEITPEQALEGLPYVKY
jgi:hypothetical protein